MGDFVEDQNTAAQIVGGLIALIPVLERVVVACDVSGALFNINRRGGFAHADAGQLVNLGFAAFGAVPEVGEAFKTVFKPLWKERAAARGAIHGGLEAVERLLGMRKGGAITWVREELISRWGSWVQRSIVAANTALDACVALTEFVATAEGWKHWLIPSPVQALAQQMLPGLKAFKGRLDAPLSRAGNEIEAFLKDLVGEQAASVVMAVGQHAVAASLVAGARSKSGHNAAQAHPKGRELERQPLRKVGVKPEADAGRGSGPIHNAIQNTRKALSDLAAREKGLIGEHMVDYHEAKRLGGSWPHDRPKGQWAPDKVRKLNVDKRPVNLSLADLPKVNRAGIDAVWSQSGSITVTEAKASESIAAAYGFGAYKAKKGIIPKVDGLNPDLLLLHYLLSDSSDKRGKESPTMQMTKSWVEDRSTREGLALAVVESLRIANAASYTRRAVLVSGEASGAIDHAAALADVHAAIPASEVHAHQNHGIVREWDASSIDAVEKARDLAHAKARQPSDQPREPRAKRTRKPKS